jgi:hypothetical protein
MEGEKKGRIKREKTVRKEQMHRLPYYQKTECATTVFVCAQTIKSLYPVLRTASVV